MDVEVKRLFSSDTGSTPLEDYSPDDPTRFGILVAVDVGTRGDPAADQFSVMVCSPAWLDESLRTREPRHLFGRHYLIMPEWDFEALRNIIDWRVKHTAGGTWEEFASHLDLYFHWEFGQP